MVAAAFSLNSSHNNWQEAVRSGNSQAQAGAVITMVGSTGHLVSNSYSAMQTGLAFKHVLAAASNSPARVAAWAVAGRLLSTVFFRFNLVGVIFTVLELAGSWLYNRYNLSLHDRWLLSTPWSLEPEQRQSKSLSDYQKALRGLIQAPRMEVVSASGDKPPQFLLHFPTLTIADLTPPLMSHSPSARLLIGGYQVERLKDGREPKPEQWSTLTDGLEERLAIHQSSPLILSLADASGLLNSKSPRRCDLVLSVQFGHITEDDMYVTNPYTVRFPAMDESGSFPSQQESFKGDRCPHFRLYPALLPDDGRLK